MKVAVSPMVSRSQERDLLSHSTIEMTERYAHLSPDNVRTAVAALNGLSRFGHAGVAGVARMIS